MRGLVPRAELLRGRFPDPTLIMTTPLRSLRYFRDAKGNRCAGVPLANTNLEAVVYLDDLHTLAAHGLSLNWKLNSNGRDSAYVKAALPGRDHRVIARIVAGASFKQQVHYRNGNRLDLRRDNLRVGKGGKAHKDCSDLPAFDGLSAGAKVAE